MNWIAFGIVGCLIMLLLLIVVFEASKVKPHNIKVKDREFEVYLSSEFQGHMCCVSIYEVMPNRKIFKKKYRCYKTFWISHFETLKEGVYAMINSYIIDEEEANLINDKWKELDNGN